MSIDVGNSGSSSFLLVLPVAARDESLERLGAANPCLCAHPEAYPPPRRRNGKKWGGWGRRRSSRSGSTGRGDQQSATGLSFVATVHEWDAFRLRGRGEFLVESRERKRGSYSGFEVGGVVGGEPVLSGEVPHLPEIGVQ